MDPILVSYLSLRYESEEERKYLQGLASQYLLASESESYHMALFAYHLLFMSFVYQTIHKIKTWLPENFRLALITFPTRDRNEYLNTSSPWVYSGMNERTVFGLLHVLVDCDNLVAACKATVDYRNGLGHANPILVGKEEFYTKVGEYDALAGQIQVLTHDQLVRVFAEFTSSCDSVDSLTADDIELGLIVPNRLSVKDLECFAADCSLGELPIHTKINSILRDDFGVDVALIWVAGKHPKGLLL